MRDTGDVKFIVAFFSLVCSAKCGSHPSVSPEEAVGQWDAKIEVHDAQDVHLHL